MERNLKKFYIENYPTDSLAISMNGSTTFDDLFDALVIGKDVYYVIGVQDSLIRGRLFLELSRQQGCDYVEIYKMWLS